MGTAEKFFLTPKDTDEYDNVPPLDMFDAEIDVYRVSCGGGDGRSCGR